MFQLGGHCQDHGAEGVAGGANGVGGLFGMAALAMTPTTGAIAGLDVELRDDGDDGRQVGLILDYDARIDEVGLTIGTVGTRYLDDAIDAFGWRRGSIGRRVSFTSSGFLGTPFELASTKGSGLPMSLSLCLVKLLAETFIFVFDFGEAALQSGNTSLQSGNGTVACVTARTSRDYHDNPPLYFSSERDGIEVR